MLRGNFVLIVSAVALESFTFNYKVLNDGKYSFIVIKWLSCRYHR